MDMSREQAAAIADLTALAEGRLPLDAFGAWVLPQERADGTRSWPHVAYTPRFRTALAVLDHLLPGLEAVDYIAWQSRFAGPLDDPTTIAAMAPADLAAQMTRIRRGERFSDGFWLRMVESGALLAALRRGLELAESGAFSAR